LLDSSLGSPALACDFQNGRQKRRGESLIHQDRLRGKPIWICSDQNTMLSAGPFHSFIAWAVPRGRHAFINLLITIIPRYSID
ncbi:MAG: hypothetical protein VXZ38_00480, partial [Planctomycetota bacterium]|nr:hypothetical protein [Planctomycetota bacterium]